MSLTELHLLPDWIYAAARMTIRLNLNTRRPCLVEGQLSVYLFCLLLGGQIERHDLLPMSTVGETLICPNRRNRRLQGDMRT